MMKILQLSGQVQLLSTVTKVFLDQYRRAQINVFFIFIAALFRIKVSYIMSCSQTVCEYNLFDF